MGNISDTIGSIVKCAFLCGMPKNGVMNVSDFVKVVRAEKSTKKFVFPPMEVFPTISRISVHDEWPIKVVMKIHSLSLNGSKVIGQRSSCLEFTVLFVIANISNLQLQSSHFW